MKHRATTEPVHHHRINRSRGAKELKKVGMVKEGRGTRYLLRTNLKSIYRKLTGITRLTDGTVVEVISHPTLNKVQGTVFEADSTDVDEETNPLKKALVLEAAAFGGAPQVCLRNFSLLANLLRAEANFVVRR